MFLIDPNLQEVPVLVLANTRTVTSCPTSTHRDNFRGDVEGRDRNCVLTGSPVMSAMLYTFPTARATRYDIILTYDHVVCVENVSI